MVAAGAGVVGALVGLAAGVALSVYVALLDVRKRADGLRSRAQYRARSCWCRGSSPWPVR